MVTKKSIGILALQGDVTLHQQSLRALGVEPILVKLPSQLNQLDGLIIPGGESTALLKLAEPIGMLSAITSFSKNGGSIFGTCAGAILLAKNVTHPAQFSLSLINIDIKRNGYGRQLDSAETSGEAAAELGNELPMTFIRAPRITKTGNNVDVLATYNSDPVLVRQGKILAATFHPELTDSHIVYNYWLGML